MNRDDFVGYADPPSARDAKLHDADLELGKGNPEDVLWLLKNLDDFTEFSSRIAAVIRLHTHDPKGQAHLAAGELREFLAEQMIKGPA